MTALTDQFTGIAQRSVDATTTAVRAWTENAQHYAGSINTQNVTPSTDQLRSAAGTWFDLAATLLAEQRALAFSLLDAGVDVTGMWTEQARTAAAAMPFRVVDGDHAAA